MVVSLGSLLLVRLVGRDFFPDVDSGTMRLHARMPPGTRIEETEARFADLEQEIRAALPAGEIDTILDNIGIPNAWSSLAQGDVPNIAATDGEILISLNREQHGSVRDYEVQLRKRLAEKFPDMVFFFEPANITNQILNFGLPAPIDLQVVGTQRREQLQDRAAAARPDRAHSGRGRRAHPPGVRAAGVEPERRPRQGRAAGPDPARRHQQHADFAERQQPGGAELLAEPGQRRQLQRRRADAAVPHRFARRAAAHAGHRAVERRHRDDRRVAGGRGGRQRVRRLVAERRLAGLRQSGCDEQRNAQLLSNLVDVKRSYGPVIINHYNVAPVFDVYANVDRRDLGSVGREVEKIMKEEQGNLPRGTTLTLRGEYTTMQTSFFRLGLGIVFAVVLVYLLMAVNFQSWLDPFIILTALPGAMAGILWMLFVTGTTLSVPSLMGSIMSIGVATANSILMVTFANDERATDAAGAARRCCPPATRASGRC